MKRRVVHGRLDTVKMSGVHVARKVTANRWSLTVVLGDRYHGYAVILLWPSWPWRLLTWPRRVRHLCICCKTRDTRTEADMGWCGLCKHGYCPRRERTGKDCRR